MGPVLVQSGPDRNPYEFQFPIVTLTELACYINVDIVSLSHVGLRQAASMNQPTIVKLILISAKSKSTA